MAVSFFGDLGSVFNVNSFASVWKPKSSSIRVGREVGAFTSATFSATPDMNRVIGDGDDVALKSNGLFSTARMLAMQGHSLKNFRQVDPAGYGGWDLAKDTAIHKLGDYAFSFDDKGSLIVSRLDADTGKYAVVQTLQVTDDMRIGRDAQGDLRILTGNAARTGGVLKAQGQNEFLIRKSGADVEAGEGTVVFNLSSRAGTYSGGNNVTYLGAYQGGTFTQTGGNVNFAGYFTQSAFTELRGESVFSGVFEKSSIALTEGEGIYSGYFSASAITASDRNNTMSGMFLDACIVRGGDGNDLFSGRFIKSEVDGGGGDDVFGKSGSLKTVETLFTDTRKPKQYNGLAADFVHSTVNAGAGNDEFTGIMWGGELNLAEGENRTDGIFVDAVVNGGAGDDELTAVFSSNTVFNTGLGKDKVELMTAVLSTVNTGEGDNTVTLGRNGKKPGDFTWQTRSEYFMHARPSETGELANNIVNAEAGDNVITIHNGLSTSQVLAGNAYEEKTVYEEKPSAGQAPAAAAVTAETLLNAELTASLTPPESKSAEASQYEKKIVREAVGRYLRVMAAEPLSPGNAAVSVNTGRGRPHTFYDMERTNVWEEQPTEKPGMLRRMRRAGADGSYAWIRWERVG